MIHVSNAILKEAKQSEDTSPVKELVKEYKDRFKGIDPSPKWRPKIQISQN